MLGGWEAAGWLEARGWAETLLGSCWEAIGRLLGGCWEVGRLGGCWEASRWLGWGAAGRVWETGRLSEASRTSFQKYVIRCLLWLF